MKKVSKKKKKSKIKENKQTFVWKRKKVRELKEMDLKLLESVIVSNVYNVNSCVWAFMNVCVCIFDCT